MTYSYTCDGYCQPDQHHDEMPAFAGELRESWYDNRPLADTLKAAGCHPGQTITFCPDCVERLLLHEP